MIDKKNNYNHYKTINERGDVETELIKQVMKRENQTNICRKRVNWTKFTMEKVVE